MKPQGSKFSDKQKMIVVAALGVVVLGVGAFQFAASGSAPPKSSKAKKASAKEPVTEESERLTQIEKLVAGTLPQRDPFLPGTLPLDPATAKPPADQPKPTESAPNPTRSNGRRNFSSRGGTIAPMDPMGQLPPVLPNGEFGGKIGVQPSGQSDPHGGGFTVAGTVTGDRPVAVLTDGQGNQRVVPLGGQIDPETKVVGIEKGKVTIERRGKRETLGTGGASNGQ